MTKNQHKRTAEPCPACGTWVCDRCRWRRVDASKLPGVTQICYGCRGTEGHFEPVHHYNPGKAQDHRDSWEQATGSWPTAAMDTPTAIHPSTSLETA